MLKQALCSNHVSMTTVQGVAVLLSRLHQKILKVLLPEKAQVLLMSMLASSNVSYAFHKHTQRRSFTS